MARTGRPRRVLDLATVQKLLASGRSLRSVARELGIPFSTLWTRLHETKAVSDEIAKTYHEAAKLALREYLKTAPANTRELYERPENRHLWE